MTMNIAIHFEIPVQDLERAIRFYEGVFETVLERVQIDGNEMALFPLESGTAGCSGALAKGRAMCRAWMAPGSICGCLTSRGPWPGHWHRAGPVSIPSPGSGRASGWRSVGIAGESHRLAGGNLTIIYPVHGIC